MLFIGIWMLAMAVSFGCFIYNIIKGVVDFGDCLFIFIIRAGVSTCVVVFVGLMICAISHNYYTPIKYEKTWPIYSLSLNNNYSLQCGGFFIGWTINGKNEMKYYFYVKGKRGLKLESIDANKIELNETMEQPMFIDSFETRIPKYPLLSLMCDDPNNETCQYNHEYILNIPLNTVKLKFNVDHSEKQKE